MFGGPGKHGRFHHLHRPPVHIHHHVQPVHNVHVVPPAPTAPMYPTIPPIETPVNPGEPFAWIPTSAHYCDHLLHKAIQVGHEGHDHSPIYLGRAYHEGDLLPCKVIPRHKVAYVAYNGKEISVPQFELYCRQTPRIDWVPSTDGNVPPGAVPVGRTSSGETLFAGRTHYQGSITPGKIHGTHRCMYISFGGCEVSIKSYEVMVLNYS